MLREHEQSSSDEIPEVCCIHPSRAYATDKASRFDVRCISIYRLYSFREQLV